MLQFLNLFLNRMKGVIQPFNVIFSFDQLTEIYFFSSRTLSLIKRSILASDHKT